MINRKFRLLLLVASAFMLFSTVGCKKQEAVVPEQVIDPYAGLTDLGKFISVVPMEDGAPDTSIGNEVVKQKIIETIAKERGVKIDFEIIELPKDNFINEFNELSATTYIDSVTVDYEMMNMLAGVPNLCKALDTLLESHGTNIYNTMGKTYWNETKYNDQIFAIPSTPFPEQSIILTRADKLPYFSFDKITKMSELKGACAGFLALGFEYPMAMTWDQIIDTMGSSYGIFALDYGIDKKDNNSFKMREFEKNYRNDFVIDIQEFYKNGFLHPDVFTATPEQMKADFMSGKSAIYVGEYSELEADRILLKQTFPDAELSVVSTPITREMQSAKVSAEKKVDKVLMFMGNGQHSEALMVFLDWMYESKANHAMVELGAFGQHVMYNSMLNEYEYMDDEYIYNYSEDNKPYKGLYQLGLSTDMIFSPIYHKEYTLDIMAVNKLELSTYEFLKNAKPIYETEVQISDSAKPALEQYKAKMDEGLQRFIKSASNSEFNVADYKKYEQDVRGSGLLDTLTQEIGVPLLYELGIY